MFKLFYLDREHIPRRQMLFGFISEWLVAVVVVVAGGLPVREASGRQVTFQLLGRHYSQQMAAAHLGTVKTQQALRAAQQL
jgi:hypothetical protein